jgi:hypothetical protein
MSVKSFVILMHSMNRLLCCYQSSKRVSNLQWGEIELSNKFYIWNSLGTSSRYPGLDGKERRDWASGNDNCESIEKRVKMID